jgi:hypothetical protein
MSTAIEAWADSPLLPDLHRQRYKVQTKAALNNNEQTNNTLHLRQFVNVYS